MTPRTVRCLVLTLLLALAGGCEEDFEPDAWGHFEATEVAVSAEAAGRLLAFRAEQGMRLAAGAEVGRIEVTGIALRREELARRREGTRARVAEVAAQADVLRAQLATAAEEAERLRRLHADRAATAEQLNRQQGEVRVLEERIEAARAQARSAASEVAAIEAQIAIVEDDLADAVITNPVAGTVLVTFVEAGEVVTAGQRLYEVADLGELTLRAYVSGAQLPQVRLGQRVTVYADAGETARRAFPGTVTWIAGEAEFTPTPIQTKEERVELVYALDVAVPNPNGFLKIGMPGEVVFTAPAGAGGAAGRDSGGEAGEESGAGDRR